MLKVFCPHKKWEVLSDQILESGFEQLANRATKWESKEGSLPMLFFQKTHIFIVVCIACGKINKTITKNP